MTQLILNNKPSVNMQDKIGRTALHFACRRGNLEILELIIKTDHADEIDVDI